MFLVFRKLNLLLLLCLLSACKSEPVPTESTFYAKAGDIVVANDTLDAVYLLDEDGNFKRVIYNHVNTENAYGVNYHEGNIIFVVDGVDRVLSYNVYTGATETIIQNPLLTGTLRGLATLTGGDTLVIETNAIERFDASFNRVSSDGWPKTLMTTPNQINPLTDGGFILCATGTDAVRTYDETGTQVATVSSPGAGATNPYSCLELPDGRIAAAWEGTSDRVVIYSADLSAVEMTFNDITKISNPRALALASNGNLLVADYDLDALVEITLEGEYVRTIGDTVVNNPAMITVIPSL